MGALSFLWFMGAIVAYFVFRSYRSDHPVLSAWFWPIVGGVLLLGALTNPSSSVRRFVDDLVAGGRTRTAGVITPTSTSTMRTSVPPDTNGDTIERPKYGLIETADSER